MRAPATLIALVLSACDTAGGVLVRSRAIMPMDAAGPLDASISPDADATPADASPSDAGLFDAALSDASGLDAGTPEAMPRDPGMLLGDGEAGYYYAARQGDYTGASVTLNSTSCSALVNVASNFADAVCIEGVGKLSDGRVLQFSALCACGYACPGNANACFAFEDAIQAPWGRGSSGRSLAPLRSLAVDPDGPLVNKVVYLPALDGVSIADSPGLTGFVHDGCVRADDSGQFVSLLGFRLFTGDVQQYTALDMLIASDSSTPLYLAAPHCQGLTP